MKKLFFLDLVLCCSLFHSRSIFPDSRFDFWHQFSFRAVSGRFSVAKAFFPAVKFVYLFLFCGLWQGVHHRLNPTRLVLHATGIFCLASLQLFPSSRALAWVLISSAEQHAQIRARLRFVFVSGFSFTSRER
jgi:hypothetical protein